MSDLVAKDTATGRTPGVVPNYQVVEHRQKYFFFIFLLGWKAENCGRSALPVL